MPLTIGRTHVCDECGQFLYGDERELCTDCREEFGADRTCSADGAAIGPDDCCPTCGVHYGDPCPACGQAGYHAVTCPEVAA